MDVSDTPKPEGSIDIYKQVLEEAGVADKDTVEKPGGKRDKRTFNKHLDHLREKQHKEISKKKQDRVDKDKKLKYTLKKK